MLAPLEAEFAFRQYLGIRPSLFYGLKPVCEVRIVADRGLPDGGDKAEAIQSMAAVKVDCGGIHHLAATRNDSEVADRFNGSDAQTAIELAFEALATRGEKVASPAIEADAINEISRTLGGFEIVLPGWDSTDSRCRRRHRHDQCRAGSISDPDRRECPLP